MSHPTESNIRKVNSRARRVPFGWITHPDKEGYLLKVEREYAALDQAREYWQAGTVSHRDLASWVTEVAGRSISFRGLIAVLTRGY